MDKIDIDWNKYRYIMNRKELIDMVEPNSICVELGIWQGWFAEDLLTNKNVKKLYLVDPYSVTPTSAKMIDHPSNENEILFNTIPVKEKQIQMDYIYESIVDKFKNDDRVEIIRDYELNVIDSLEPFNYIHVDGNQNQYERFLVLEKAFSKLLPNGILLMPLTPRIIKSYLTFKHHHKDEIEEIGLASLDLRRKYVTIKKLGK